MRTKAVCLAALLSVFSTVPGAQESIDAETAATLAVLEAEALSDADVITLQLDPGTYEDHDLMEGVLSTLPDGEVPRNTRKLIAGVVAEMRVALSKRMSGDFLTLDDGSQVFSGGKKKATKKKAHGATVVWAEGGQGGGQPSSIVIIGGNCVRILTFPESGGAPHIASKCTGGGK